MQVHVADHRHRIADLPQRGHGLAHLLDTALGLTMAVAHRADHFLRAVLQLLDDLAGFLHRLLSAARKVAHLIRNHGKTASGFTGAGGFDGGVERQEVGLLGDGADGFQHRADLLAVRSQPFDLNHRCAHVGGEGVDACGGAVDHGQALTGGAVGVLGSFGGLRGAACNVLGSGAHFVGSGGDLIDLTVLLLHAGAGLGGDG